MSFLISVFGQIVVEVNPEKQGLKLFRVDKLREVATGL